MSDPRLTTETPVAPVDDARPADAAGYDYFHQKEWRIESGVSQSPIDIRSEEITEAELTPDENDAIVLHVSGQGAAVIDNGHTVQLAPLKSSATIRGRHFTLAQVHFHAPAEHTIDGLRHPLEGHYVCKAQDGRLAVIAVLYSEGRENQEFSTLLRAVRDRASAQLEQFNAAALAPESMSCYYHYLGSLTTPPLTENVEWYVLHDTVELAREDIEAFQQRHALNARDPQPLNGRPLLRYDL